jgi:hypothetical protein
MDDTRYNVTIEDRQDHLFACLSSEYVRLEMLLDVINQIRQGLVRTGHRRLLYVRDFPMMPSPSRHHLAINLAINTFPKQLRVAVVNTHAKDKSKLGPIVQAARSSGWDYESFDTVEEAEAWLNGT